jgi:CRISPR system Cascade subunit CasE
MIFSRITLKGGVNVSEHYWTYASSQDYALHQTVWDFFRKKEVGRDFLFRTERMNGEPMIYTVSERRPFIPKNSPWYVDAKLYDPMITAGERLYFSVRVSACKKRYEENGKLKKADIVIAKKRMLRRELPPDKMPLNQEIAHVAASEWMKRQGEANGFVLFDFQVTRHDWNEFNKKNSKGTQRISFPSLDLDGTLRVTSSDDFRKMLFKGIGAARSFGCGLMLVRRI